MTLSSFLLVFVLANAVFVVCRADYFYLIARVRDASSQDQVSGWVKFTQEDLSTNDVTVEWDLSGISHNPDGEHGFHVHQYGDISDAQAPMPSTGYHFVPTIECLPCENATDPTCTYDQCMSDQVQGWPPSEQRHPGDMGNITFASGSSAGSRVLGQEKMSLQGGYRGILGRSLSIHVDPDDGTQPWGNAGTQIATGVIGIANPTDFSHGQTVNNVSPPDGDLTTTVVCTFTSKQDMALNGGNVNGTILFKREAVGATTSKMYVKLDGVSAGTKSLHFHQWGDVKNSGSVYEGTGLLTSSNTIETSSSSTYSHSATLSAVDLHDYVGRTLSIHDGATSASDVIAVSACGIPNPMVTSPATLGFDESTDVDDNDSDDGSSLSGGEIAAIVIVCIVVPAAILFMAFRYRGEMRRQSYAAEDGGEEEMQDIEGEAVGDVEEVDDAAPILPPRTRESLDFAKLMAKKKEEEAARDATTI